MFKNAGNVLFQTEINSLADGCRGVGVVSGYTVTASASMNVYVSPGTCRTSGNIHSALSSQLTLAVGTADGTYGRYDSIFHSSFSGGPCISQGTPGMIPNPPNVSGSDVMLGILYVGPNVTDVGSDDVINNEVVVLEKNPSGSSRYEVSDDQMFYDSSVNSVSATTYTTTKELVLPSYIGSDSALDISFRVGSGDNSQAYARITVNGTEKKEWTSTSWDVSPQTLNASISGIAIGATVAIQTKHATGTVMTTRNFGIKGRVATSEREFVQTVS